MDCGEATDFVHRIRLVDDKPFRLPYRRVPPCHYDKLRTALNEMEELGIIRKSQSEYSSPLVLVVKPSGDLRICNDFRWLNARTVKDTSLASSDRCPRCTRWQCVLFNDGPHVRVLQRQNA